MGFDVSEDWYTGAMEIIGVSGPYPQYARAVPGGLTRVDLWVVNRGSETNLFTVAVEGDEGEWATVQPGTVSLPAFHSCRVEVTFRVPTTWSPAVGQSWYSLRVSAIGEPRASERVVGCLALESHLVTTSMLEARMRPGAWSDGGFLGPDESLTEVIERDASAIKILGLGYEQFADGLERLLSAYQALKWQAMDDAMNAQQDKPGVIDHAEFTRSLQRVTDLDLRFAVAEWNSMGHQPCPWDDDDTGASRWSSSDWLVRNLRTGQEMPLPGMEGPGLIIHLIREHGFFEGLNSPYRVDPIALARLLELGPYGAQ
jgi:hypothetical protein